MVADALSVAADVATILLAAATAAAFLASRRAVVVLAVASAYAREVGRHAAPPGWRRFAPRGWIARLRALRAFLGAAKARAGGEDWSPARELELLRRLRAEWREGVVWRGAVATKQLAEAYGRVASRLDRSLALRIGSPTMARDEAALCRRMERIFGEAGTFRCRPSPVPGAYAALAAEVDTELLIAPSAGLKGDFDEVFCSMRDEHVGAPPLPFAELAAGVPGRWPVDDPALAAALDERVAAAARHRADDPLRSTDFNGALLRLEGWRAEVSDSGLRSRLHLQVAPTNFATLLATNGGLHLDLGGPLSREEVRDLCLDRLLEDPRRSPASNALAVHLAVISRDGYLVLVERSRTAEWAAGRLNSAANGLVEIAPRVGLQSGDIDEDGIVRVELAAIREAHEELGEHLDIKPPDVRVRALALDVAPGEQVTPYVVLEARCKLSLREIAEGHFWGASRAEGAFEVGERIVGLPIMTASPATVTAWLRENRERMTRPGLLSSLLTLGRRLSPEDLLDAWRRSSPARLRPLILPTVPGAAADDPAGDRARDSLARQ